MKSKRVNHTKLILILLVCGCIFCSVITSMVSLPVSAQSKPTNDINFTGNVSNEGSIILGKTGLELHFRFELTKANATPNFIGLKPVNTLQPGQPIPNQFIIGIKNNTNGIGELSNVGSNETALASSATYLQKNQVTVYSNISDNTIGIKIPTTINKPSVAGISKNLSAQTTLGDINKIFNPKGKPTLASTASVNINTSKTVLNSTANEICNTIRKNANVTSCKPDIRGGLASLLSDIGVSRIGGYTGDVINNSSWAPWRRSLDYGDAPVTIYVMDSGVNQHLGLNLVGNVTFVGDTHDNNNHGTHVAGIAAARDARGSGVIGMAPGAKVFSIKVLDSTSPVYGGEQTFKAGLEYIRDHAIKDKIKLVNLSITLGVGTPFDADLKQLVKEDRALGVTFIAAADNYHRDCNDAWPCDDPNVIVVGAMADSDGKCGGKGSDIRVYSNSDHDFTSYVDKDDQFSSFSNFGNKVDFVAPGDNINSTDANGVGYHIDSGTSMAAPFVTGTAALYLASHPQASPSQVKTQLEDASASLPRCDSGGSAGIIRNDPSNNHEPLIYAKPFVPP
jgi:subtilisin family serine protease